MFGDSYKKLRELEWDKNIALDLEINKLRAKVAQLQANRGNLH